MYIYFSAKRFKHKLHQEYTIDSLQAYLNSCNIELVFFSLESNQLIGLLGLEEYAKTKTAFTYLDDKFKIVFVHESLQTEEKIFKILHEICHIRRGHKARQNILGADNLHDEKEANDFAYHVLTKSKKPFLFIFLIATLCIFCLYFIPTHHTPESAPAEYKITVKNQDYEQNMPVCKTKTGTKYHKESCSHLVGRSNTKTMTLETAITAGLESCDDCFD